MGNRHPIISLIIAAIVVTSVGLVWRNYEAARRSADYAKHHQYPTYQAASPWVVVNKGRVLPADYSPADLVVPQVNLSESAQTDNMHLRRDAAAALKTMFAAASRSGLKLMLVSGYRSYAAQQYVYSGYVDTIGTTAADESSARPGFSEHQTGLAADVGNFDRYCELKQCFGGTPAGKWLVANSYKYGFVIRYAKGKQGLTGYEYEPWHVRYVGDYLAGQLHITGQTLEQFFSLPAYPDYATKPLKLKD